MAEIEDALRGAGARGELVLHYQPEVRLRTNQIVACEALLRWRHPEWGLVPPAEFIPVAETSNLILEIGDWVLREALGQIAALDRGVPRPRSRSRSPSTSRRSSSSSTTSRTRSARSWPRPGPTRPGCASRSPRASCSTTPRRRSQKLTRLKALGVQLAIDDFGTGYSSLSYLRRFPVDILKVDQSFVSGLGHDPGDSAIVQAVVHMGQALHMTTLAEGVETAHHVIELRELDCDIAQGFHFARPVPAADFSLMLRAGADWLDASTG